MKLPYQWQPKIVSTQVAVIGGVVIAGVPGEFTTMSGRRLREAIKKVMNGASDDETSVIVAGLCNTYSDYITTPEEYQVNCSLLFLTISICSRIGTNLGDSTRNVVELATAAYNIVTCRWHYKIFLGLVRVAFSPTLFG